MKISLKTTVILIFALALSTVITGCAGCGNDRNQNMDDMVESTPAAETDQGIIEDENAFNSETHSTVSDPNAAGGNATAGDINGSTNGAGNGNGTTDANGNIIDDAGNIVNEVGNAVGDAVDNAGDAAKDVLDGVENGARTLTR